MTRIVAGAAGGRRLRVPAGGATRPTSERAREGLFSTLQSIRGPLTERTRFADLYAGSGAVGLEALSRGAGHVLFVESDARAVRVIRENVEALALPGAHVQREKVERVVAEPPEPGYDVVFLDPPYHDPVDRVLAAVARHWLRPAGVVVVERSSRDPALRWPPGVRPLRCRRYGDGTLWYGRRS